MLWSSKDWCCDKIRDSFAERYERGIFVFAEPPSASPTWPLSFWLGIRTIRRDESERLKQLELPADLPILLQTWERIHFCPWCGVRLDRHYRRNYQMLIDQTLSDEHGLLKLCAAPSMPKA